MVALRSGRQDRRLIAVLWVLTLAVLGTGVASAKPVLIFWGVLGVAGSVFLTRVHVRDTRSGPTATPTADTPGPVVSEVEEESSR